MVNFYNVTPNKQDSLEKAMEELGIYEKDIEESFICSGGKGGQKVNKTSSCVYLKHIPTGVEVKMQKERYQSLNRFLARRLLVEKISRMIKGESDKERNEIEKIRRQKRRRSKRAKEKMLKEKKITSEKKKNRIVARKDW